MHDGTLPGTPRKRTHHGSASGVSWSLHLVTLWNEAGTSMRKPSIRVCRCTPDLHTPKPREASLPSTLLRRRWEYGGSRTSGDPRHGAASAGSRQSSVGSHRWRPAGGIGTRVRRRPAVGPSGCGHAGGGGHRGGDHGGCGRPPRQREDRPTSRGTVPPAPPKRTGTCVPPGPGRRRPSRPARSPASGSGERITPAQVCRGESSGTREGIRRIAMWYSAAGGV